MRRIKPEQVNQLDLSCLRSAGNGAEPINPRVLEAFYRTFAPCGFRWEAFCPAYGLAETTLMVSCCSPSLTPRVGRFRADALGENRVVETADDARGRTRGRELRPDRRASSTWPSSIPRRTTRCAADQVGEIWVADPSVAQGYWRRAAETEATFRAFLADTGEGPFLRTGDLGFIRDGELYRHQPHQRPDHRRGGESLSPGHRVDRREVPSRTCAPAVSRPSRSRSTARSGWWSPRRSSGARSRAPKTPQQILDAIRRAIAEEHEVPVHALLLLARGSLPKTASGKVQRHGCWRLFGGGQPRRSGELGRRHHAARPARTN